MQKIQEREQREQREREGKKQEGKQEEEMYWEILKCLCQGKVEKAQSVLASKSGCEVEKSIFSLMVNNWQYKSQGRREVERIVEETQNVWGYVVLSDFYLYSNNYKASQKLFTEYLREYGSFSGSIAGRLVEINEGMLFFVQGLEEKVFELEGLRLIEGEDLNFASERLTNLNSEADLNSEAENNLILFIKGKLYYLVGRAKRGRGELKTALSLFEEAEKIFRVLSLDYYIWLCKLERSFCKTKEIKDDELIELVSKAVLELEKLGRSQEAAVGVGRLNELAKAKAFSSQYEIEGYHFISRQMKELRGRLVAIASDEHNVIIQGERGTGKEGIAKTIHLLSSRKDKPFIKVNVCSLNRELFKSALFGYEKGAFTGADKTTEGLLDKAQGGTLFLDEIGELPEEHQSSLLDVIQYKRFKRVGGTRDISVDIKFITATNQELDRLTEKEQELRKSNYEKVKIQETKLFRGDFRDRFVWEVIVPRLEDRREELGELIRLFLEKHGKGENFILAKEAEYYLLNKKYSGNIRTLENDIIQGIGGARGAKTMVVTKEFMGGVNKTVNCEVFKENTSYQELIDSYRYKILSEGLDYFELSAPKLAKSLALPKRTLYRYLEELNLSTKGKES